MYQPTSQAYGAAPMSPQRLRRTDNRQPRQQQQQARQDGNRGQPSLFSNGVLKDFREHVLARGGANGIRTLGSIFRRMDDNQNRALDATELQSGCNDYGLRLTLQDANILLNAMDRRNVGSVNFDDFLLAIRGPMNNRREQLVRKAFSILDRNGNGTCDVKEMASMYDASGHPDVVAGRMTPSQALREFMAKWESNGIVDGTITLNEFMSYYQDVSASVDRDDYFELMMRNAWHISGGSGNTANTSNLRVLVVFTDGTQRVVSIENDLGVNRTDIRGIRTALRRQGITNIAKVSTAM